jgi:predicted SAM-dependent methyltransferase
MTFKNLPQRLLRKLGFEVTRLKKPVDNRIVMDRLLRLYENGHPIKLHFGCGPRIIKGWVNIDISYAHYQDYLQYYTDVYYPESIRGNKSDFYNIDLLETGLPLPDNSVDIIFHEDFFEHLTQKEQVVFLAETLRVMKNGAIQRINTPNLLASMRDNSNFKKGRDGVFTGEWDNWHHYSVMSPAILKDMALMIGYKEIRFNSKNKSIAFAELPLEYRPDGTARAGEDSNVFADLIK